ncbi:MAG: hypothetical protein Q9160_009279 [Pyrenula sp. 1 TL-2023]
MAIGAISRPTSVSEGDQPYRWYRRSSSRRTKGKLTDDEETELTAENVFDATIEPDSTWRKREVVEKAGDDDMLAGSIEPDSTWRKRGASGEALDYGVLAESVEPDGTWR